MHIAYLHYIYGQGTALNHATQFADAARRLGHRVDVHAMNLAPPEVSDPGELPATLKMRQALKRRFSRYLHDPKEFFWNVRYVPKEISLLRDAMPEILLVRDALLVISCVFVARRLGLPLVLEVNAPAEEARRYFDQYLNLVRLQEWALGWKLKHADAVTVVSSALKDYFLERYDLSRQRILVVPNGADVDLFHPERPPDAEYARDTSRPTVGFVGSFQEFHGLDLLVAMIERISAIRPDVRFLLVGGRPGAEAVTTRMAGHPRVIITGRVPYARVADVVASFDIGVMPESNFYGSPLKVIEWMAAGRAVVAPRYAPLEEIIRDGIEGVLFTPGDLDALVGAVVQLVDDSELRGKLGAAAATRVRSSLTWRHNAEKVVGACELAAERHRS